MTKKSKAGRPLKFKTPEELQAKINEYYAWAELKEKPLTIERLACFLEVDRDTINHYEDRDAFFHTIKTARDFILASKIENLNLGKATAGIIFDVTNNYNYENKLHNKNQTEATINLNLSAEKVKELDAILENEI